MNEKQFCPQEVSIPATGPVTCCGEPGGALSVLYPFFFLDALLLAGEAE